MYRYIKIISPPTEPTTTKKSAFTTNQTIKVPEIEDKLAYK